MLPERRSGNAERTAIGHVSIVSPRADSYASQTARLTTSIARVVVVGDRVGVDVERHARVLVA